MRESLSQPLIVIFEDLHWIDEETQRLLNLLADSIGTGSEKTMSATEPSIGRSYAALSSELPQ